MHQRVAFRGCLGAACCSPSEAGGAYADTFVAKPFVACTKQWPSCGGKQKLYVCRLVLIPIVAQVCCGILRWCFFTLSLSHSLSCIPASWNANKGPSKEPPTCSVHGSCGRATFRRNHASKQPTQHSQNTLPLQPQQQGGMTLALALLVPPRPVTNATATGTSARSRSRSRTTRIGQQQCQPISWSRCVGVLLLRALRRGMVEVVEVVVVWMLLPHQDSCRYFCISCSWDPLASRLVCILM